jgi:hypothetical protein
MLNRLVLFIAFVFASLAAAAPAQLGSPQLKTAAPADKAVQLSWNAVPGATSYNIYWSTGSGVTKGHSDGHANNTGIAYTVPTLTNGTLYYFVVTAVDADGESSPSNELSATPATQSGAQPKSAAPTQPTTNVGQSPDTNVETPTMIYVAFPPATYPVVAYAAGAPNGKSLTILRALKSSSRMLAHQPSKPQPTSLRHSTTARPTRSSTSLTSRAKQTPRVSPPITGTSIARARAL